MLGDHYIMPSLASLLNWLIQPILLFLLLQDVQHLHQTHPVPFYNKPYPYLSFYLYLNSLLEIVFKVFPKQLNYTVVYTVV